MPLLLVEDGHLREVYGQGTRVGHHILEAEVLQLLGVLVLNQEYRLG